MSTLIPVDRDLVLRELRLIDAKELFQVIDRNRANLRNFLPWLDFNTAVLDSQNFILNASQSNLAGNSLILCVEFMGKIVGMISLAEIRRANKSAPIGYWLCEGVRGQGLMIRAVKKLISYSFENLKLNRLEIRAAPDNQPSRSIPEKLGFKQEGVLRDAEFLYNRYVDLVVYSILKREWGGG